eukprot:453242_1
MTISGIAWDTWVLGNSFVYSSIIIVSIFFFISFTLFLIRICQVYKQNSIELVEYPEKLLQFCHLSAMFFSSFYMFLYVWNYLHIYSDSNEMNCTLWYILIMTSITMTKVFIYSFLMLRSTLSFRNSFFEIPLKTSISITLITCISQLTWCALMLYDFEPGLLTGSMCFRILGPLGTLGIVGFNINDAISAFVALLIFWIKAKSVKRMLFLCINGNKKSKCENKKHKSDTALELTKKELTNVFNKHIKLGMLIVIGSILIFLAGEFLTMTMGLASCLHQCLNNIYIFLLFKENNNLYNIFCICKYKKCFKRSNNNTNELAYHLDTHKTTQIKVTKPTSPNNNNVQSEGCKAIYPSQDIIVIDVLSQITDVHDTTTSNYIPSFHINTPSSIPRFMSKNDVSGGKCKKDKKSASSHNLQVIPVPSVSNLKLINVPTLTGTPTVMDKKMKNYGHINHETLSTPIFGLTPISPNDKHTLQNSVCKGMSHLVTTPANSLHFSQIELPHVDSTNNLSVVYD